MKFELFFIDPEHPDFQPDSPEFGFEMVSSCSHDSWQCNDLIDLLIAYISTHNRGGFVMSPNYVYLANKEEKIILN